MTGSRRARPRAHSRSALGGFALAALVTLASHGRAEEACPAEPARLVSVAPELRAYVPCPERCSQSEACVAGRCVLACEPECRDGTYCTEVGVCVPLPRPVGPVRTEATLQAEFGSKSKNFRSVAWIDIAGVLFDGAQLAYEWGGSSSWIVGFRPLSTGFLSYSSAPQNEFEQFDYGASLALSRRYYEKKFGNLRGLYYGFGVEVFGSHVLDSTQGTERVTFEAAALGHFGYRWAWNSFVFGFGPVLGFRVPVYSYRYGAGLADCPEPRCTDEYPVSFRGALNVEFGFFP